MANNYLTQFIARAIDLWDKPVGSLTKYMQVSLKIVKAPLFKNKCKLCHLNLICLYSNFKTVTVINAIQPMCHKKRRKDKKDVYFAKVKEV